MHDFKQDTTKKLKQMIKDFSQNRLDFDDEYLDDIIGIKSKQIEQKIDNYFLAKQYGYEQFTFEATPYTYIYSFIHAIKPTKDDIVYDLGSGYGRVVIFGALLCEASFKGIEIVPARVRHSIEVKNRLTINNARFYCRSVLDYDFSDGNIFFLFNPFSRYTLLNVIDRLKEISYKKKIRVVTWGGTSNDYLNSESWLKKKELEELQEYPKIDYFESAL